MNNRARSYQRLSVLQKRALDLGRVREPSVMCPICHTQMMPVDLNPHMSERCQGPREPGPGAKWISHRDALVRGVQRGTLSKWVDRGVVRVRGERGDRQYLLEDLAMRIAWNMGFRRR
jgi:hypothetical protein